MISVGIAFRAVCVSAVSVIFIPVSKARVKAMLFIGGIAMLSIRVGAMFFIRVWVVAVMIVPPAVMMPVARVSIGPFMIPV
jgi:ABC-type siderophore export system fused ATPase/permease subunit